jgi:hypothetical protein
MYKFIYLFCVHEVVVDFEISLQTQHLLGQRLVEDPSLIAKMVHIPNEIFIKIFENFFTDYPFGVDPRTPGDKSTLARLCRCSKRLRDLAEPILYRSILFEARVNIQIWETLVRRQHLWPLVRKIYLFSPETPLHLFMPDIAAAAGQRGLMSSGPPNLVAKLYGDIYTAYDSSGSIEKGISEEQEYSSEQGEDGLEFFSRKHIEARFALLLFPRLELLEVDNQHNNLGPLLYEQSYRSGYPPAAYPFTRLRELVIHNRNQETRCGLKPAGLLAVPNLEILKAGGVFWDSLDTDRCNPGIYLNIRFMQLLDAIIDGAQLSDMLSRCPKLKELHISWGLSADDWDDDLDFDSIGDALRRHGQRLERLELDFRKAYLYAYEDDPMGRIGSLRKLTHLKVLRLQHDALIGRRGDGHHSDDDDVEDNTSIDETLKLVELLPRSLEILQLYSSEIAEEQLDDQIYELIDPNDGQMEHLHTVIMGKRARGFSHPEITEFGWEVWDTKNTAVVLDFLQKSQKLL